MLALHEFSFPCLCKIFLCRVSLCKIFLCKSFAGIIFWYLPKYPLKNIMVRSLSGLIVWIYNRVCIIKNKTQRNHNTCIHNHREKYEVQSPNNKYSLENLEVWIFNVQYRRIHCEKNLSDSKSASNQIAQISSLFSRFTTPLSQGWKEIFCH